MYADDYYTITSYDIEDDDFIISGKGRYEDYPLFDYIEEMKATWYDYAPPLHPRKDWQRKPFWLRIRSNPVRADTTKAAMRKCEITPFPRVKRNEYQ